MATEIRTERELNERLNDLYWNSDLTIDEIVADLGISRNALYAGLEPIRAGGTCAVCGGAFVFPNRTHRAAGTGTCEQCGTESGVDESTASRENGRGSAGFAPSMGGVNTETLRRLLDGLDVVQPRRAAMIGGAAAIGMLIGVAAVRSLRS